MSYSPGNGRIADVELLKKKTQYVAVILGGVDGFSWRVAGLLGAFHYKCHFANQKQFHRASAYQSAFFTFSSLYFPCRDLSRYAAIIFQPSTCPSFDLDSSKSSKTAMVELYHDHHPVNIVRHNVIRINTSLLSSS